MHTSLFLYQIVLTVVSRIDTVFTDDADPSQRVKHTLSFAKDFLNQFCQLNWTSPSIDKTSIAHDLLAGNEDQVTHLNSESLKELSYDGEVLHNASIKVIQLQDNRNHIYR